MSGQVRNFWGTVKLDVATSQLHIPYGRHRGRRPEDVEDTSHLRVLLDSLSETYWGLRALIELEILYRREFMPRRRGAA